MAVVTTYATEYPDPTVLPRALDKAVFTAGTVKCLYTKCAVANGDSIASKLYFGRIPSSAVIHPTAAIYSSGITSLTDFDLGDASNPDGIVDGADVSTAAADLIVAAASAYAGPRYLWEMLGYSSDPGKELEIYGTLNAAAGAAGTIAVFIPYSFI